jgi:hypothetical protein
MKKSPPRFLFLFMRLNKNNLKNKISNHSTKSITELKVSLKTQVNARSNFNFKSNTLCKSIINISYMVMSTSIMTKILFSKKM